MILNKKKPLYGYNGFRLQGETMQLAYKLDDQFAKRFGLNFSHKP